MNYIKSLILRFWNAVKSLKFWTEGLMVFVLSGLGVWWPLFFEWKSYDHFFYPEPWFTYGLATLMIILGQRLFMKESDDSYIMPNRLILLILTIIGGLLYGKSVLKYFKFMPDGKNSFDYSLTMYAVIITMLAWLIHFTGNNDYDNEDPRNALGGS